VSVVDVVGVVVVGDEEVMLWWEQLRVVVCRLR